MQSTKPLNGIRVIDLTQAASGPMCAAQLAAFGAEVIKIEAPGVLDSARRVGPYGGRKGVARLRQDPTDVAIYFLKRNRGKKGITLNLKSPKGLEILYRLVDVSDVVLDNYRPGVTERLKVNYDVLKARKRDIICCSITGFGHFGPYRNRAAYDTVVQAMSGAMEITGFPDRPPVRAGFLAADGIAPLFATTAILAALRLRDRTGAGQFIDVSMLECLSSIIWDLPVDYIAAGGRAPRTGNQMGHVPGNVYPCRDGSVVVLAGQPHQWIKFARLMGREDMLEDPRFASLDDRLAHAELVDAAVEAWTKDRTRSQVLQACEALGLACGAVATMRDVAHDPQLAERGFIRPLRHPLDGEVPGAVAGSYPVHFSAFDAAEDGAAPMPGQDNSEVLSSVLGLPSEEIEALKKEEVI